MNPPKFWTPPLGPASYRLVISAANVLNPSTEAEQGYAINATAEQEQQLSALQPQIEDKCKL